MLLQPCHTLQTVTLNVSDNRNLQQHLAVSEVCRARALKSNPWNHYLNGSTFIANSLLCTILKSHLGPRCDGRGAKWCKKDGVLVCPAKSMT